MLIAGQWGDAAPSTAKTTVALLRAFEESIEKSDAITIAGEFVQVRNNLGQPTDRDPLAYMLAQWGPPSTFFADPASPPATLEFELLFVLYANHGPISDILNAAEFMAAWSASASDQNARNALIAQTFPGVNVAIYNINKMLWQAQQTAPPPVQTAAI